MDILHNSNGLEMDKNKSPGFFSNTLIRLRDIVGALLGLLLFSPLLSLIAIWIKYDSPGPILYRGWRSGKGNKKFKILKFRTMYEEDSSYSGPKVTAEDDCRITPIGKWLRYTKLNELPQFWNVLVGEMSIVGPRPEDPEIVLSWPETCRDEILSIRPGISSPASVLYRDEESLLKQENVMDVYLDEIAPSKMRLDQLYVRHRSFWGDLDVIFWTFIVLFPRSDTHELPERDLFAGTLTLFGNRIINWFTLDLIVSYIAIVIAGLFWRSFGPLDIGVLRAAWIAFSYALIFSVVGWRFGIQKVSWSKASLFDGLEIIMSTIVATSIILFANIWVGFLPYQIVLISSSLALIGFLVVRYRHRISSSLAEKIIRRSRVAGLLKERVLIIGSGDAGQFSAWMMENSRAASQYEVVGFIDDAFIKMGTRIRGKEVLGGREEILRIAENEDVGVILFAIHNIVAGEQREILNICHQTQAKVVIVPDIFSKMNEVAGVHSPEVEIDQYLNDLVVDLKAFLEKGDIEQSLELVRELEKKLTSQKNGP